MMSEQQTPHTVMGKIGVIGCGQMGSGIAQVCAQAGYVVLVSDTSPGLLQKGLNTIRTSLEKQVKKGNLDEEEKERIIARVTGTTNIETFSNCDLVIEAAAENLALKKQIFGNLDIICPSRTILASNTSSLSIDEIAEVTRRKDRVLGIHFFNPVPALKLVEIVNGASTSQQVLETVKKFVGSLGKTLVTVQDAPGFIVNRLMAPQILNAIRLVDAGVASKEDVDTAMTLGLNHPVGPLALADLIGLDTLLSIAESLYQKLGEPQYAAPDSLKKMVAEGHLGRKTGRGFFKYD
jgi:3-hydroxybutyryl-CoA dehydrogenase